MKRFILTAFICAPVLLFGQSQSFSLKGKIGKVTTPARVYISYNLDGTHVLDSVAVKDGQFEFKGTVSEPTLAKLLLDRRGIGQDVPGEQSDMTSLFLEAGNITITAADSLKNVQVKGSPLNEEFSRYEQFLSAPKQVMSDINTEYQNTPEATQQDPAFMKGLEARFRKAYEDMKVLQKAFVEANPDSYFSLLALGEAAGRKLNVAEVEPLYNSLSAPLRNSRLGKELKNRIEAAK